MGVNHPNLRSAREAASFGDEEFADIVDVPVELLLAWESGRVKPDENQRAAISGALGIPMADVHNLVAFRGHSRLAELVARGVTSAGLRTDDLAELLGITEQRAQEVLTDGRRDGLDLDTLSYHIDVDPEEVEAAAATDRLDAAVAGGVRLATLHPELEPSYHPNNVITFADVAGDADVPVLWQCVVWPQHQWSCKPQDRPTAACPLCAAAPVGNLADTDPDLAEEWHPDNKIGACDEVASSWQRRLWRCHQSHRWSASPAARLHEDADCPECTSVHALRPDLSAEWHRDNARPAAKVKATSTRPAVWQCSRHRRHVWVASPAERVRDSRCPHCAQEHFAPQPPVSAFPSHLAEWDDKRDPATVLVSDGRPARWRCRAGHRWNASPAAHVLAQVGCPACERGWDEEALRDVIASLGPDIVTFSPAELFTIFQQSGVAADSPEVAGLLTAISLGTLTADDLGRFGAGAPSQVEGVLDDPDQPASGMSGQVPALRQPTWRGGGEVTAVEDADAAEFLVASGTARLLELAYSDLEAADCAAMTLADGPYAGRVRERYAQTVAKAQELEVPAGWSFSAGGAPAAPNLMQRVVAARVRDERRLGNWSGTGAGKTLSALLASRVVGADITLITCPNAVVATWASAINGTFPVSMVALKNLTPPPGGVPSYLVANYEHLQRPDAPAELAALAATGRVGMVVVDEIHQAKQRNEATMSLRRQNLQAFVDAAALSNPALCVLGMSATPVINTLTEGASLLRLITGEAPPVGTDPTVANCMQLHQALVRHGIRWMPTYDAALDYQEVAVDCVDVVDELRALPNGAGVLAVERLLTRARLPAILDAVRPKTLIYTHLRSGIVEQLTAALEGAGWRAGCFTGVDKSGLPGFLAGDVDVLVATSSIGTGVDGLQHVCNRVVVNVLPWTDAEYTQLKGRVWRQGQQAAKVDFVVPVTGTTIDGERWSWCQMKLNRLRYKRSVADAAVDGVVPDEFLRSPEQAAEDALAWLRRLLPR